MAIQAAGVYTKEYDLTQIAVAQGNMPAGIVVAASRGIINELVTVTSSRQYLEYFGKPDPSKSFTAYAALAYLEQGNQLSVVRVVGGGARVGALLITETVGGLVYSPVHIRNMRKPDIGALVNDTAGKALPAGTRIGAIMLSGPGSYSDQYSIKINSTNMDTKPSTVTSKLVIGAGGGPNLPVGSYTYSVSAINSAGETEAVSLAAPVDIDAAAVADDTGISLSWVGVLGATGYRVYRSVSGGESHLIATVNNTAWVDRGDSEPDDLVKAPTASTVVPTNEFDLVVTDRTNEDYPVETSYRVSLEKYINGMGQQLAIDLVLEQSDAPVRCYTNVASLATIPVVHPQAEIKFPAGSSGSALGASDYMRGWDFFSDVEQSDVRILINGGVTLAAVQKYMVDIAVKRADCIAFLDTPASHQAGSKAADWRNIFLNVNTNRAALFAQDLLIQDMYNNQEQFVPSSGHMAALAARTAYTGEVWMPMAGLNRGQLNVLGVRYKYANPERQSLKKAQVNYIREFKGDGICLMEQITLQSKQSALSWISVRFLLDELQSAMKRALMYFVHELNDDFTRRQIVTMLESFLQNIQDRRGIKKFLVVSGDINNNAQTELEGILNIEVFVAPTLPIDQIKLSTVLTRSDANFEELAGNFI